MKKVATRYTIYLIIGIIVVFAVIIGGTYAIFKKSTQQTSTNIVSTLDCINVSITGNSSSLTLTNAYPLTHQEGINQTPYNFTVKNNCETYVEYQIIMSVVNTSTIMNKEYVKIDLEGPKDNQNKKLNELFEEPQQGLTGYLNNYTLINNSFNGSESHIYNFRMWLNGENEEIWNDSTIANQNITVKLSIIGVTKTRIETEPLRNKILAQGGGKEEIESKPSPDFTKIAVSQATYDSLPETATLPDASKAVAIVDNGIYATEDEYGMSYYYRGERTELNNNLIFGGFQWKIVRINGDGTIRIIYNGTEVQFNSNKTVNTTGINTRVSAQAWNVTNTDDVKYTGYMYGGANGVASTVRNGTTSVAATYNETSTNAKTQLDNWYKNNILGKNFENQIGDNLFCNNRLLLKEVGYPSYPGTGYGSGTTYFAGLYDLNKIPNIKCGLKNDRFTKNDTTVGNGALTYPVGLITADEAIMAGITHGVYNSSNYLYTTLNYWALTPVGLSSFSGETHAYVCYIGAGGNLTNSAVSYTWGLRPVLNISAETTVIGDGSETNPFKVLDDDTLKTKILLQGGGAIAIEAKGTPDFSKIAVSQTTYDSLPETATLPEASKSVAIVENGLYASEDEYGTSYYYRGDKDLLNNNLIFGGFQWKILRINGDGSIRILYNGTEAQFNSSGTVNKTGTNTCLSETQSWNDYNTDAKYTGYMYGGADGIASTERNGTTSSAATYNETSTSAKIKVDLWYETNIAGKPFENKIVDNIFCNERQLRSEVGGAETGLGYGVSSTVYAIAYRLITNKTPTLKCALKNDRFTVNDTTLGNGALIYPVGFISADESSFGGLVYNIRYSTNYLYTGSAYWTMTSGSTTSGTNFGVYGVNGLGNILNVTGTSPTMRIRPVLNLDPYIRVVGNGSPTNPYKVI